MCDFKKKDTSLTVMDLTQDTEEKYGWFAPTIALRHGYATWSDSTGNDVKCCAVTVRNENPFESSVTDVRPMGRVYHCKGHKYGMLPPLKSANPMIAYDKFPPDYNQHRHRSKES
jgi:hypothetical protein